MERYHYEPGQLEVNWSRVDGFLVYDRKRSHNTSVCFCLDRDDAERVVNALNANAGGI